MTGDNVYRFAGLCGVVLVVAALFAFVAAHTSALDRETRFVEAIVPLEAKAPRSKAEEELLDVNRRLLERARANGRGALIVAGAVGGLGLLLAAYGWVQWRRLVQPRSDRLVVLQLEKLQFELAALRAEHAAPPDERLLDDDEDEV